MKYLLIILILVSCKSKKQPEPPMPVSDTTQVCTLGIDTSVYVENLHAFKEDSMAASKKPIKPPQPVPPINPDNPDNWAVILLDFDGHVLSGTMWNWQGDIVCEPSGLDSNGVAVITGKVIDYLKQFKVIVTTTESVYTSATSKKQRVILTTTYGPFGISGGTSMLNSFTNNTNTPCLVFTSLLVQLKKIADASAHEVGHTLGLYHQSVCDNGVKILEYRDGPDLMGRSYSYLLPFFSESGINALCKNVNSVQIMSKTIPLK